MPVSKNHKKKPRKKAPPEVIAKRMAAKAKPEDPAVLRRATEATWPKAFPAFTPSKDFTKDGRCSDCGACCSSILPMTEAEKATVKDYADAHGIRPELPPLPRQILYMQCPFLDRRTKKCLVYPVRPGVCRAYRCDKTVEQTVKDYLDITHQKELPVRFNAWELFGKTGLRTEEGEITVENANRAELIDQNGMKYPVQVGRPVGLVLETGERYPYGVCLNLMQDAMQVFHDGKVILVEYAKIKELT